MATFPTVVKGSHLTVTTYEDGRTDLEWDWDALLRDVQNAIALAGQPVVEKPTKKKRGRKKK